MCTVPNKYPKKQTCRCPADINPATVHWCYWTFDTCLKSLITIYLNPTIVSDYLANLPTLDNNMLMKSKWRQTAVVKAYSVSSASITLASYVLSLDQQYGSICSKTRYLHLNMCKDGIITHCARATKEIQNYKVLF